MHVIWQAENESMEKYNYDFRVADHHKLTILSDSESEKKGSLSWQRNSYIHNKQFQFADIQLYTIREAKKK